MKPNNSNRNNIILAIVSLVLVAGVVLYFFNRDTTTDSLLSVVPSNQSPKIEGSLLSTLRQLKSMKLDDSIFSDPVFLRLSDFAQPLSSQGNPGRSNPFAPIGADVVSTLVQTATTTNKTR